MFGAAEQRLPYPEIGAGLAGHFDEPQLSPSRGKQAER